MKTRLFLIISCLMNALFLNATIFEDVLTNEVTCPKGAKSVEVINMNDKEFNSEGRHVTYYFEKGQVKMIDYGSNKVHLFRNSKGLCTLVLADKKDTIMKMKPTKDGGFVMYFATDSPNKYDRSADVSFDDNNNETSLTNYRNGSVFSSFFYINTYNADGKLVEIQRIQQSTNDLILTKQWMYDDNTKLLKEELEIKDGKVITKVVYNKSGDEDLIYFYENDVLVNKIEYTYTFDSKGNWIKMIRTGKKISDNKETVIFEEYQMRKITY